MGINFSSLFNQIGNNISELLTKYINANDVQQNNNDNDTSIFASVFSNKNVLKSANKDQDDFALANEALQLFDEAGIDIDSLYEEAYKSYESNDSDYNFFTNKKQDDSSTTKSDKTDESKRDRKTTAQDKLAARRKERGTQSTDSSKTERKTTAQERLAARRQKTQSRISQRASSSSSKRSARLSDLFSSSGLSGLSGSQSSGKSSGSGLSENNEILNSLLEQAPDELKPYVNNLIAWRNNYFTSVLQGFSQQTGKNYTSINSLPSEHRQTLSEQDAEFTKNVVEYIQNYIAYKGFQS